MLQANLNTESNMNEVHDVVGKKRRVLIFEDSDIFADMLVEFLTEEGFETERAENGLEGIKKVYTFLPELIVSDVEMPLFKGYQSTRLLKSRSSTKNIPIIMFTSLGESKDKFWGKQAGADYYIEKSPENFADLAKLINCILDEKPKTNYDAILREAKKINDNYIIEMINNLLDNKLYQTTLIGMLAELSNKMGSLEETVKGVFSLLKNVCQAEICSLFIKNDDGLLVFNVNYSMYTDEIVEDFKAITIADFNMKFSDFKVTQKEVFDFPHPEEDKEDNWPA